MEKILPYELHAQGDIPRLMKCPDGQFFVDSKNKIFAFVPVGENDEEQKASAKHFSATCIMGALAVPMFGKICDVIQNYSEVPYSQVEVIEKDDKVFASYNLSASGTLTLVMEGGIADLYVDDQAKAFYLKEQHIGTFLARIERELFVKDLSKRALDGDKKAALTLKLMREYICLRDEDICW
jgi:hypothetical protein